MIYWPIWTAMHFDPERHLDALEFALSGELPGWEAHSRMINYNRQSVKQALRTDPNAKQSAVLVLLYPKGGSVHTLLMLRQPYEGVHSAQVSFPGGKKEDEDQDLLATALREAQEETGLVQEGLRILGQLSEVYIKPSGYLVTPYVAWTEDPGTFQPDAVEVAELIEAPLTMLMDDRNIKEKEMFIRTVNTTLKARYFDIYGHVVWGATAMMMSELREVLGRLD